VTDKTKVLIPLTFCSSKNPQGQLLNWIQASMLRSKHLSTSCDIIHIILHTIQPKSTSVSTKRSVHYTTLALSDVLNLATGYSNW